MRAFSRGNPFSGNPALTISTDQNLLPLITTSVTGNTLQIDSKENLGPTKGITIIVSSGSLTDEFRVNFPMHPSGCYPKIPYGIFQ